MSREENLAHYEADREASFQRARRLAGYLALVAAGGILTLSATGNPGDAASVMVVGGTVAAAASVAGANKQR